MKRSVKSVAVSSIVKSQLILREEHIIKHKEDLSRLSIGVLI